MKRPKQEKKRERVFGVEPVMEPDEIQQMLARLAKKHESHPDGHAELGRWAFILYCLCEEQHKRSIAWHEAQDEAGPWRKARKA